MGKNQFGRINDKLFNNQIVLISDEEAYALKDVEAEKVLQCDLTFSLQRARTRPLFKVNIIEIHCTDTG